VWEFLSNEDVVATVAEVLAKGGATAARDACEAVIGRATHQWRQREGESPRLTARTATFILCLICTAQLQLAVAGSFEITACGRL
jgi:hypothetical protein